MKMTKIDASKCFVCGSTLNGQSISKVIAYIQKLQAEDMERARGLLKLDSSLQKIKRGIR